jgi:hypothetical protein
LRQIGSLPVPRRIELRRGRIFKLNLRKVKLPQGIAVAATSRLRQDASEPPRLKRLARDIGCAGPLPLGAMQIACRSEGLYPGN